MSTTLTAIKENTLGTKENSDTNLPVIANIETNTADTVTAINNLSSGISPIPIQNKWGEQNDIDTSDAVIGQVIWPVKATTQAYLFIDSPIQLYVQSSSTEDAPGLTGAQSITLTNWHGSDGNAASAVTLATNGIGQTALPQTSYGVFSFEVTTSGSTNSNVGTIDIVDGSSNIYAKIEPTEGRTQICVQRIPNDKKASLTYYKVRYNRTGGGNEAVMRLRERKVNGTIITRLDPTITTLEPEDTRRYALNVIEYNPGTWLYFECILTSANNTPIRAEFDIKLEDL